MSLLKTYLIVLLFLGIGLFAETLLRADIPDCHMVAMSADGNTVIVVPTSRVGLVVFKRIAATYHRIEVKDFEVWMDRYNYYYAYHPQQLRLTKDGKYMYFIHPNTGLVTKGSLINTKITNPYIEVIDIPNHACSPLIFKCFFTIHDDYFVFFNDWDKIITVIGPGGDVVFNKNMTSVYKNNTNNWNSSVTRSITLSSDEFGKCHYHNKNLLECLFKQIKLQNK